MAQEKLVHVRLEKDEQLEARELARERGVSVANLFADLIREYAAGPMPPPRKSAAVPQAEMRETRVTVPMSAYERARKRASREQKHLSDVVLELVRGAHE